MAAEKADDERIVAEARLAEGDLTSHKLARLRGFFFRLAQVLSLPCGMCAPREEVRGA